jgi:hypothetical protein
MLTLNQVEPRTPIGTMPFTISNSGSYYLTTNYSGSFGAILIETNNVTLDLNGFALIGGGSNQGIFVSGAFTNITVRNGILQQWGEGLYATLAINCRYERLQFSQNTFGLYVADGSLVSECMAVGNSQAGLVFGNGCRVVNCVSRLNLADGIQGGAGCSVIGCVAELNGTDGINIDRGLVKDCTARQNTNNGINVFINCLVTGNTCINNKICGISLGTGGHRIDGNNVDNNGFGIGPNTITGNLIIGNSATGNTTNYSLSAINTVGPIITSGSIATNTSPHANYSY